MFELSIALTTIFFSFCIQVGFYYWYLLHKDSLITKHRTVFSYLSGVVGDAVLLPIINILAYIVLRSINFEKTNELLFAAIFSGLIITFIFHYIQLHFKLINWTMPKYNQWTKLGLYHAGFMFVECSFLSYSLFAFLTAWFNGSDIQIGTRVLLSAIGVLLVFLGTMIIDYRHPKITAQILKHSKLALLKQES